MRFQQNDARDMSKWTRLPTTLKSGPHASEVVHHNTLNARPVDADDMERSREVERFFDLMTPSPPATPATPAQGTAR